MAGELAEQSSSRGGAAVLWIVIHTAEGPWDEFPARPDLDAGSARDLLAFFRGKTDRSCHAIADDDVLLDELVPYDRAAWTLRNGNVRSDNLEMCGLASWSRDEWLQHPGMLRNAARWVAGRLKARSIVPRRLTTTQVATRSARGYMDHNTYTVATADGTHWDVGPHFPWDVFGQLVTAAFNGQPLTTSEDDVPLSDTDLDGVESRVRKVLNEGTAAGQTSWASTSRAVLSTVQGLVNLVNSTGGSLAGSITDARTALLAGLAAVPTAGMTDEQRAELAETIAADVSAAGITLSDGDRTAIGEALGADLAARLAA